MDTFEAVYHELERCGTAQNHKIYKRHGASEPLFGVSFANFKRIRKGIRSPENKKGVSQPIAEKLWETGNQDARILAAMIADPGQMTREQFQDWCRVIDFYPVADAFAKLVCSSPYRDSLMGEWAGAKEEYLRRVAFSMLGFTAREEEETEVGYYEPFIKQCEAELQSSENRAKESMNNALIAVGGVNDLCRKRVLAAAEEIGPVEIDHGQTSCKTFVISEYVDKIWARKAKK